MENKISIIIPTYNSESTIKECLDSVFNSNFKDFDVILISDKSTDGTVEIAKKYNCQIIELSENKGPAYVRNLGAKTAKGYILFFIDSDVIIKRDALSILNDEFNKKKIMLSKEFTLINQIIIQLHNFSRAFFVIILGAKKLNILTH